MVYELWQGTIHSHDGALQLLLLVDFVRSWARDVYRPAVRKLIFASKASFRQVSPVSTDRFRQSESLCPTTSSAATPHYSYHSYPPEDEERLNSYTQSQRQRRRELLDVSSHECTRWTFDQHDAPAWTQMGIVRHSTIANFKLRCYSLSSVFNHLSQPAHDSDDVELFSYAVLYSHSITVSLEQLHDIVLHWTMEPMPALYFSMARTLQVTFYFQTYCDHTTWQINKILTCIVWREEDIDEIDHADAQDLVEAVTRVSSM